MRIGLVIYGSLDTLSGGYLYDRYLVEHLRQCGDEVEIISLPWVGYVRRLGHNFSRGALRRLAAANFDLLIQDELNHPSLVLLNRLLRRRKVPIVSIVHHLRSKEPSSWVSKPFYWMVERLYLGSVDYFIFNSETTRQVTERIVGDSHPGIVAKPAGNRLSPTITDQQIAERALNGGALRLLFLGNVIHRKGLHVLLEALQKLPADTWELTIVGSLATEEAYARRIQKRVADLGWERCIRFTGPLHEAELVSELEEHHVLTLPSLYEGFGIAYLEGMGFGLPAIGSSAGGAPEVISEGRDGFLIPPGDSNLLAVRLQTLHQDRSKLAQMSLAARNRFAAHPTWEASMIKIRTFLAHVIEYTGGR